MEDRGWNMAVIRNFRELNVYQRARIEGNRICKATQTFPPEQKYSLTDQIRRSSRAVKSMVAEAWAHRRYPAAFINKLADALGEATETQSWLDDAPDCESISVSQHKELDAAWQSIGAGLNKMIERSYDFCKNEA